MMHQFIISTVTVVSLFSSYSLIHAAFLSERGVVVGRPYMEGTCDDRPLISSANKHFSFEAPINHAINSRERYQSFMSVSGIVDVSSPTDAISTSSKPKQTDLVDDALQKERMLLQSSLPSNKLCTAAIDAWCRAGRPDRAEDLLRRVGDLNMDLIRRTTYHTLLTAHVDAGTFKRALEILKIMENSPLQQQHPITMDYNVLLAGYAVNGRHWLRSAEQLIDRMIKRGDPRCQPDTYSYSYLVDALTLSEEEDAHERIEDVINHLSTVALSKKFRTVNSLRPYQIVFNKALKFWRQCAHPDAAFRAESILKRMEQMGLADYISYTSYMSILVAAGTYESAECVHTICNNMYQSYLDGNVQGKPTCQTWNTVISAWVRCGEPEKAECVLCQMENEFGTDVTMAPNVVSYSTVMDGWAKSNRVDAVEHMEKLFERLKERATKANDNIVSIQPNSWTYGTLIHAYAKQNDMIYTQKAENLIYEMYHDYENGNIEMKPNTIHVTAVMEAWGKSATTKGAEKAEALLDWMISLNKDNRIPDLAPNEFSFSSVIAAWGRSRSIGKSTNARRVLNKMIELHESGHLNACPNTICYTAVINSCAYCVNDVFDKRNALRIAIGTYKDLEKSKYGAPNHVTYANLLNALRNLLPKSPQRSVAVQDVFRSAIKNGCVDLMVIQRVKAILSIDEIQALYPSLNGEVRIDQIPNDWYRNINFKCP